MPNILYTIETRGPGGAEILLFSMAKYCKDNGFSNHGYFIKEGWIKKKFNNAGFKTIYHPLKKGIDLFFLIHFIKIIKKYQIDVIHSHEFAMSFYSSIASLLTGVKVISTFHGMNYHCDTKRRQWMMKFIAQISNIVAVSEDVRTLISSRAGINKKNILLIENGIKSSADIAKGGLKDELNLPEDCILVGTVGRLHKIKGHKYLVKAAKNLVDKNDNIYFIIAGDGAEKESIFRLIIQLGLSKRFFLIGARNDIPNLLSSLDIFILPSLSEGTSLALLEAMSYGLPIIATKVGNNPNLIKNSKHGFLIRTQHPDDIADCVQEIIDKNMFFMFSSANKKLVKEFYSFEKMMGKYLEIYSEKFIEQTPYLWN